MRQHIAERSALLQLDLVAGLARKIFEQTEKKNAHAHRNRRQNSGASLSRARESGRKRTLGEKKLRVGGDRADIFSTRHRAAVFGEAKDLCMRW
ncbi:MAG: hypothetical protein WA623_18170 [Candidatus Sulfotelmatobacter sp.]